MRQHIFKIFFQTQNLEQQSGYKADVHLWFKKYRRYKLVSTCIFNGLKQKTKAYEYEMEILSKSCKIKYIIFTLLYAFIQ